MDTIFSLSKKVVEVLASKECFLGVSESITGGAISASITRIDGASRVLFGAQVLYSTLAKRAFCELDLPDIERIGTISLDMVKHMDACMAKRCFSMISRARGTSAIPRWFMSVATSGIASGSVEGKPTGLVYILASLYKVPDAGFDVPEPVETHGREIHLVGSREEIIDETVRIALSMVLEIAGSCY